MSEQPGVPAYGEGQAGAPPMSERMQALLSRAVEDQLTEQRQLASLVAEVRALLSALPGEVAAAAPTDDVVRSEVSRLRAGLAAVEQRLAVLTAAAERPTDLSAVTGPVGSVAQEVGALGTRLSSLESALAELSAAVTGSAAAAVESEQRVLAHVDEAVLALAEVMVRRSKPGAEAARPAEALAPSPQIAPAEIPAVPMPQAQDPSPPDAAVDIAVVEDLDDDAVDLDDGESDEAEVELEDELGDEDDSEADELADEYHEDVVEEADEDEVDDEGELEEELDDDDDDDDEVEAVESAAAPSESSDPWAVPSPFQPGPPRERADTGAAAAIAELHAGEADSGDTDGSGERGKRRPWWKPGD